MMSTIISHDDTHYKSMLKLHNYAVEKGVRDKLILIAGGTQVTPEIARTNKMDQGFGREYLKNMFEIACEIYPKFDRASCNTSAPASPGRQRQINF